MDHVLHSPQGGNVLDTYNGSSGKNFSFHRWNPHLLLILTEFLSQISDFTLRLRLHHWLPACSLVHTTGWNRKWPGIMGSDTRPALLRDLRLQREKVIVAWWEGCIKHMQWCSYWKKSGFVSCFLECCLEERKKPRTRNESERSTHWRLPFAKPWKQWKMTVCRSALWVHYLSVVCPLHTFHRGVGVLSRICFPLPGFGTQGAGVLFQIKILAKNCPFCDVFHVQAKLPKEQL